MVKELMQSNRVLRDTIDQLNTANEKNEGELYTFQVENRELRDRIEILESVIASTTH
jgi:NADH:ubiquinone oxidoreductase subunit D